MSTARIPSQKSLWGCGRMHHWAMRYSVMMASLRVTDWCLWMASSEIFTEVGLTRRRVFSAAAAHSVPSASRAATMASPELQLLPKHRSMAGMFASRSALDPSGTSPAAAASIAPDTAARLPACSPSPRSRSSSSGSLAEEQKCVARPARRQSAACRRWPVSPRKTPTCMPAGSRERAQVVPTSGNRPIPVSGMANIVFSVATRIGLWIERPTPPPITIPSQMATCSIPVRSCRVAISWSSWYSS
mmetsp:Transcript_106154/g.300178  ORF Transcript_106154/g.300178 Transcript_106154/m.300178 type:complete len:245 (+) Transcript_106154:279-1013(+)